MDSSENEPSPFKWFIAPPHTHTFRKRPKEHLAPLMNKYEQYQKNAHKGQVCISGGFLQLYIFWKQ